MADQFKRYLISLIKVNYQGPNYRYNFNRYWSGFNPKKIRRRIGVREERDVKKVGRGEGGGGQHGADGGGREGEGGGKR